MKVRAYMHYKPGFPIHGIGYIAESYTREHRYVFTNEKGDTWKFNDTPENLEIVNNTVFWIPLIGALILWINTVFDRRMPLMNEKEYYFWICLQAGSLYLTWMLFRILISL